MNSVHLPKRGVFRDDESPILEPVPHLHDGPDLTYSHSSPQPQNVSADLIRLLRKREFLSACLKTRRRVNCFDNPKRKPTKPAGAIRADKTGPDRQESGSMNAAITFALRSSIALLVVALATQVSCISSGAGAASTSSQERVTSSAVKKGPPDLSERLQRTLERSRARTVTPGAQAAVMRDGELIWFGNDGRAVRRPSRRVSDNTLFCFASFGKMFLAAFTLRRVEEGILELDEPIRTYIGRSVPGAGRVTVRMLLSHTAGYPDLYSHPKIAPLFGRKYDPSRKWTFGTLLKGLSPPRDPGERWEYSNTGYLVLGYVLRETTRRSLPHAFMDFVAPAGAIEPIDESSLTMRRTRKAAQNMAHGYQFNKKPPYDTFRGAKTIPTDLFGMPWGDGAFSGTALGAAQFLDALLVNDLLLQHETVGEMIEPTAQSLKKKAPYGLGTERIVASKRTWQGHSGAYGGFSSMAYTDPESGGTIVVVANGWERERLPAVSIWRDLARVYIRHGATE
jgi:D-alanyl-D-alanine carboxypeptidase